MYIYCPFHMYMQMCVGGIIIIIIIINIIIIIIENPYINPNTSLSTCTCTHIRKRMM